MTSLVVLLVAGLVYGISAQAHLIAGLTALALLALLIRSAPRSSRQAQPAVQSASRSSRQSSTAVSSIREEGRQTRHPQS